MAVSTWPEQLKKRFLIDGYSEAMRESRLRSNVDVGPAKVRRRGRGIMPVQASFYADYDDKTCLERFYEDDLADGTLPFIIEDQTHDEVTLLVDSGEPLITDDDEFLLVTANWLVRFREPPVFTPYPGDRKFLASLALDVYP